MRGQWISVVPHGACEREPQNVRYQQADVIDTHMLPLHVSHSLSIAHGSSVWHQIWIWSKPWMYRVGNAAGHDPGGCILLGGLLKSSDELIQPFGPPWITTNLECLLQPMISNLLVRYRTNGVRLCRMRSRTDTNQPSGQMRHSRRFDRDGCDFIWCGYDVSTDMSVIGWPSKYCTYCTFACVCPVSNIDIYSYLYFTSWCTVLYSGLSSHTVYRTTYCTKVLFSTQKYLAAAKLLHPAR
jgi:hypothetical protein